MRPRHRRVVRKEPTLQNHAIQYNTVILNETIDEYDAIVAKMEQRAAEQQRIVAEWDEQIKNNNYRVLYNAVINEFLHLISLSLPS